MHPSLIFKFKLSSMIYIHSLYQAPLTIASTSRLEIYCFQCTLLFFAHCTYKVNAIFAMPCKT